MPDWVPAPTHLVQGPRSPTTNREFERKPLLRPRFVALLLASQYRCLPSPKQNRRRRALRSVQWA